MNSPVDCDIVIAGGGMVGASLALLLSHHSKDRLNIVILESFNPSEDNTSEQPIFRPSFDARSSALSYGSRKILEPLGIWPQLEQHCAPINSIHVCEKGQFGSTLMISEQTQWPALGYVIENAWLGNVLLAALKKKSNITYTAPASVSAIQNHPHKVVVDIETKGQSIVQKTAQLAVVADGANSKLRHQLGIAARTNSYEQTALIANVSFSKPHKGRAYERFTDQGPMALLPLNDSEQGMPRAALVWTMPEDKAHTLSHCSDSEFLNELQQRFGNRQGEFIRVGARTSYPLMLVQAQEQIRSGIVIMGNAAHSLHPVAGQGFNLALRDCVSLARMTADNSQNNVTLGDISYLGKYFQQQLFDQQKR